MKIINKTMFNANLKVTKNGEVEITDDNLTDITVPGKEMLDMIIDDLLPNAAAMIPDPKRDENVTAKKPFMRNTPDTNQRKPKGNT